METIRAQITQYFRNQTGLTPQQRAAKIGVAYRRAVNACRYQTPEIFSSEDKNLQHQATIFMGFTWHKHPLGHSYWSKFDLPTNTLDKDLQERIMAKTGEPLKYIY